MADGSRHNLYIVRESTYGITPSTPNFDTIRYTGTTLGLSKNTNQSNEIRSDRQISDFRHGTAQVGGDINFELSYGSFDTLIEAALSGDWDGDVLKAGVARRSFSFLRHFTDLTSLQKPYHLLTGCEVNTFSLSIAPDNIVNGSFGFLGKGLSTSNAEPSGSLYEEPTTSSVFDSFTGSLKEGGTKNAVITEISFSLENGLEPRFVVGSSETIKPEIKRSNLTGSITAYFENSNLLDKFINETESSIEFELLDLEGNQYTFLLPRVKYSGGQPDIPDEGSVTLSMPFQALLDDAEDTNVKITRVEA